MKIYYVANVPYSDEVFHSGIKGQKWGIRRFQNPDGSYTEEGKIRYGYKGRTNAVRKSLARGYRKNLAKSEKAYQKSKNQKDTVIGRVKAKRFMNKGYEYSRSAEMYKKMSTKYEEMDRKERNHINRKIVSRYVGGTVLTLGAGIPIIMLTNDRYLRNELR